MSARRHNFIRFHRIKATQIHRSALSMSSAQTPEIFRQMFHKTPKQQQTPEIFPQMFQKTTKTTTNAGNSPANVPQNAKTTTNAGDFPANVPKNHQNSNIFRRKNSGKCSKKAPKRSRGLRRARYETRVGSPPDFQPKRVSAPSCFRARFAALRQFVALANQVARGKTANPCALP